VVRGSPNSGGASQVMWLGESTSREGDSGDFASSATSRR
jgi:hypothetical protein